MPFYNYAIATGHNNTTVTNLETVVGYAPTTVPLGLGSVRRTTLDDRTHTNGKRNLTMTWGAAAKLGFQALINGYLGGFDVESADVTIVCRNRDEAWIFANAVMQLPLPPDDYLRGSHGAVEALAVLFRNVTPFAAYPLSANLLASDGTALKTSQDGFLLVNP